MPGALAELRLVDHHAHSVVASIADRAELEGFLSESGEPPPPGCSYFDSFLGVAVLREAAPVLGLPVGTGPEGYVARRIELGGREANRLLLQGAGVEELLVDHGFHPGDLVELPELAELAATPVRRVVRLEHLAEEVAGSGIEARRWAEALAERLSEELSGPDPAVGCKSVLAYRYGLDVDPSEPGPAEVRAAVEEWLSGGLAPQRLAHPVLLRHLVWVGIRAGVPLQFHTGYGDSDLELHRSDPSLLTGIIRSAAAFETPIMLLHCYPYHRQAAYLAGVYPHVYFDVGLGLNFVGYRADAVLAEAIESAPFHKLLYSSDAFGLAELHLLAAAQFRRALAAVLAPLDLPPEELSRIAEMIGSGNARRVYQL